MIFDKNYDKTLKLLIEGDNYNRDKIINFIESVPSVFLVKIQNKISEYKDYKLNSQKDDNKMFYGEFNSNDGYLYSFNIDNNSDILRISRNVCKYGLYFSDIDLVLSFYSNDFDSKKYIGYLTCDYDYVVDEKSVYLGDRTKIEYFLINMPFNNYLISLNRKSILRTGISIVNVDDLVNINIKNLKDNKLIRSRKKS